MEIIISPELNKIEKKERIKTPFFYAINNIKKDYKFFRIKTKSFYSVFNNSSIKVILTKLDEIVDKNNNYYDVNTIIKSTNVVDSYKSSLADRNRSLDFYYFFFLGYYDLKNNQENYIKFLEEYLYFYFEYVKQAIKFFNSSKFKKLFINHNNNLENNLKYIKNDRYLRRSYIRIPSLLKCPDIGKFTISCTFYHFTGKTIDYDNLKLFLNFNNEKIKECFTNKNLNNFFNYKNLNSTSITEASNNKMFNFTNEYKNSKLIFTENSDYLDDDYLDDDYDDDDYDDDDYELIVDNKYEEKCLDVYYKLFNEEFTLKQLFEKALNNLIKSGYSF